MLKNLVKKKHITRNKRTGELGGAEMEYALAESTIIFLRDLKTYLDEILNQEDLKKK